MSIVPKPRHLFPPLLYVPRNLYTIHSALRKYTKRKHFLGAGLTIPIRSTLGREAPVGRRKIVFCSLCTANGRKPKVIPARIYRQCANYQLLSPNLTSSLQYAPTQLGIIHTTLRKYTHKKYTFWARVSSPAANGRNPNTTRVRLELAMRTNLYIRACIISWATHDTTRTQKELETFPMGSDDHERRSKHSWSRQRCQGWSTVAILLPT